MDPARQLIGGSRRERAYEVDPGAWEYVTCEHVRQDGIHQKSN